MFEIIFRVQMNGQALVPYNFFTLRDNGLAINIARCLNFSGAENSYIAEFERLMTGKEGLVKAKLVVSSNPSLRILATIVLFQKIHAEPNLNQPVFQYFSTLLETGRLNERENIELA